VMGVEHFGIGGLTAHHKAVKAGAAARAEGITPSQRIAPCA